MQFQDELVAIGHTRRKKSVAAFDSAGIDVYVNALPKWIRETQRLAENAGHERFGLSPIFFERARQRGVAFLQHPECLLKRDREYQERVQR